MSDYLDCGHPRGSIAPDDDFRATGKTHCTACERGGWVYCCPEQFEGWPEYPTVVDVTYRDLPIPMPGGVTIDYGPHTDIAEWTGEEWLWWHTEEPVDQEIYAWRLRPNPAPPLPEGE